GDVDAIDMREHLRQVVRTKDRILRRQLVLVVEKVSQGSRTYHFAHRPEIHPVLSVKCAVHRHFPFAASDCVEHGHASAPARLRSPAARRTDGMALGEPRSIALRFGDWAVVGKMGVRLDLHRTQHVDEAVVRVQARSRQGVKIAGTLAIVIRGTHHFAPRYAQLDTSSTWPEAGHG